VRTTASLRWGESREGTLFEEKKKRRPRGENRRNASQALTETYPGQRTTSPPGGGKRPGKGGGGPPERGKLTMRREPTLSLLSTRRGQPQVLQLGEKVEASHCRHREGGPF